MNPSTTPQGLYKSYGKFLIVFGIILFLISLLIADKAQILHIDPHGSKSTVEEEVPFFLPIFLSVFSGAWHIISFYIDKPSVRSMIISSFIILSVVIFTISGLLEVTGIIFIVFFGLLMVNAFLGNRLTALKMLPALFCYVLIFIFTITQFPPSYHNQITSPVPTPILIFTLASLTQHPLLSYISARVFSSNI